MKYKFLIIVSMLLLSTTTLTHATGRMTCDSGPETSWKTKAQLEEAIVAAGWQVRRIKVDGGCYEVYGTNPDGKRVEAYFDPLTLEKLLVAQRGKILFQKGQ